MTGAGAGTQILDVLARIEGKLDRLLTGGGSVPIAEIAPDSDLDGKYGDEDVKRDPPRWSGSASFAGRRMSQCSADFLDCLAEFKTYCADQDERKSRIETTPDEREKRAKYAGFNRRSAARARGWAARLRAGWKPAPVTVLDELDEVKWG